ncbi:hypothetical protein BDK51DRAFT_43325 [Blyttiomyces helicus]|uniref:Uncharacterized protein n=1 Tax=Blyttiomyces helicus TaxID=388810 RepID=A0A4P9W4P6_9FUNG|nr:hypothetical protein BDK51DRAFT_43325 [Blyttiomyces helicus]|eukprot:RKO86235.1 hypothetical protein BDK51DRAFT_43325 [Blyttiomyces helicus]
MSSSPTYGTGSATTSTKSCNPGQFLVAISGQTGNNGNNNIEVQNIAGYCSDGVHLTLTGGGGDTKSCGDCGSSCSLGPFMFYSNQGAGFDGVQARPGYSVNALSFRNNNGKAMTAMAGDNGSDVTTSALFTCPPGQLLTGWNAQAGCHINSISFQCATPSVPPLCEYNPQIEPEQTTGADCDKELNSYIGALNENAIIDAENQYRTCLYIQQHLAYEARLPFFTQNAALSGWESNAPSSPIQTPTNPIGNTTFNCCNQNVNIGGQSVKDAVGQVTQSCNLTSSNSPSTTPSTSSGTSKTASASSSSPVTKTSSSSTLFSNITSQDWIYILVALVLCVIITSSLFVAIYSDG